MWPSRGCQCAAPPLAIVIAALGRRRELAPPTAIIRERLVGSTTLEADTIEPLVAHFVVELPFSRGDETRVEARAAFGALMRLAARRALARRERPAILCQAWGSERHR